MSRRPRPTAAAQAVHDLSALLRDSRGQTPQEHVREAMRRADHRGSDVVLHTGELDRLSRQLVPYPVFAFNWRVVSHYRWRHLAHINV